jgi:hypothetical protein
MDQIVPLIPLEMVMQSSERKTQKHGVGIAAQISPATSVEDKKFDSAHDPFTYGQHNSAAETRKPTSFVSHPLRTSSPEFTFQP